MSPKPKIDKETHKVLKEGDLLQELVKSDGWKIVQKRFTDMVIELGDVFSIKDAEPEAAFRQLAARQIAIELVMNWMKDIEGRARQHAANSEAYGKLRREAYIVRDEESGTL